MKLSSSKLSTCKYSTHAISVFRIDNAVLHLSFLWFVHKPLKYVRKFSISKSKLYLQDSFFHVKAA